MIFSNDTAEKMAALLLQVKAVKLSPAQPFTWSGGWKSPIYCDNRITLSFPEIRSYIKEQFANIIREKFTITEVIAGVATAGIAHGAILAEHVETPFCYVRSSSKGHGLGNRIEGLVLPDQKVLVVEDLISSGGSSLSVVDALREAKADVIGLVAIFTYGFPVAEEKFLEAGVPFYTLTDYETLLPQAVKQGVIQSAQMETLQQWRRSPETWNA
ncbi:MAG: orotate phosphoribosyltransferase [Bacteroidetes bacterium]|nr:orotate phosphoribosyltransferase [Bacteroidota bacterium]